MAIHRGSEGAEPIGSLGGAHELRHVHRTTELATGSLACPRCDAPVAPGGRTTPAAPLACPYCAHTGFVRDFLSLSQPTRPARVVVRVTHHGLFPKSRL